MGLAVTWLEVLLRILRYIRTIKAYGSAVSLCETSKIGPSEKNHWPCGLLSFHRGRWPYTHIRACKHEHFCRYSVVRGNKMLPDRGHLRHVRHRDGWGFSLFEDHCDLLFMQKCAFRFLCVWLAGPISEAVVCALSTSIGRLEIEFMCSFGDGNDADTRNALAEHYFFGRRLICNVWTTVWDSIESLHISSLIGNWQRHSWPQQSYQ